MICSVVCKLYEFNNEYDNVKIIIINYKNLEFVGFSSVCLK